MYISKLNIKSIRCFDDVTIDFRSNKDLCMWGVMLGDNGVGKTTVLRSIAMCLLGRGSTFGLLDELGGDWIRRDKDEGSVCLEFKPDDGIKGDYYIKLEFRRESGNTIDISQKTDPDPFPWDKLFFCGYGATRNVSGTTSFREYKKVEAILTLFNETEELQNTELVLRRVRDLRTPNGGKIQKDMLNRIEEILMIPKDSISFGKEGLLVSGPWGASMPAIALGDGHRATMSWVADFLYWAILHDETMFSKGLSGIVLIDEVEQHLHPQWQKRIVKLLREQFPKVQFIATTHSPLVASNTAKMGADEPKSKLFYLFLEDEVAKSSEVQENLSELNAAQILSSVAFGHIVNINEEAETTLREASILASKDKRTTQEDIKLKKIKDKLKAIMFPRGGTAIERTVEKEYYAELEQRIEDIRRILSEGKK